MQSLSLDMSASTATESHPSDLISSETCCASSIFLELGNNLYSVDLAKARTMALPMPLLEPVTAVSSFYGLWSYCYLCLIAAL